MLAPVQDDAYHNSDFLWLRCTVLVLLGRLEDAVEATRRTCRYFSTVTPRQLLADPRWQPMADREDFLALMNDERLTWQPLDDLSGAIEHRSPTLARLIETHS